MGLSIRRQPQLHPARRRRRFVPRTARARGRVATPARGDETRKDQIAAQTYTIRSRNHEDSPAGSQAIDQVTRFFARPDRRHSFADWLRMLLEEMLVIDAPTVYPPKIAAARSIRSTLSMERRSSR
jgi:hypothetical protein